MSFGLVFGLVLLAILAILTLGFFGGMLAVQPELIEMEERMHALEGELAREGRPMGLEVWLRSETGADRFLLLNPMEQGEPLFTSRQLLTALDHVYHQWRRDVETPLSYRNRPEGISRQMWRAFLRVLADRGLLGPGTKRSPGVTPEFEEILTHAHECVCSVCVPMEDGVYRPTRPGVGGLETSNLGVPAVKRGKETLVLALNEAY